MSSYTPEQRARRDASPWTTVQMILAPLQFLAFIISFALIAYYLATGEAYQAANISALIKIALLWAITFTGMIWEKEVFGKWFMAKEFFWEDFFNLVAMIMHNLYFVAVWLGWSDRAVMTVMMVAYVSYLVNFAQFFIKGLRMRNNTAEAAA